MGHVLKALHDNINYHIIIVIIIIVITRFSCQRQGASADKLHVKAAKFLPLLDSPDPSKTQSTVGTVLSICTAPRQPGPNCLLKKRYLTNRSVKLLDRFIYWDTHLNTIG